MTIRVVLAGLAILLAGHTASAGPLTRVSVPATQTDAHGNSLLPALSGDGRYIAFVSVAPDLTPDDGDAFQDVFVHDRVTGQTVLVSRSSDGTKGNRDSGDMNSYGVGGPGISADGRFVAFASFASNLVAGDTNARVDVFVHDRDADGNGVFDEPGGIRTVDVSIAGDGTQGNDHSSTCAISADGRVVAFASVATNLVPGDTNGTRDVFVHDRDADGNGVFDEPGGVSTERASVGPNGVEGDRESGRPDVQISADGNVVAFTSEAKNLIALDGNDSLDVFVRDRAAGRTERMNVSSFGSGTFYYQTYEFGLSGDGRVVAFANQDPRIVTTPEDYGGVEYTDILIHDRVTGETTTWAENAPAGRRARTASYRPVLSHDGRLVAFYTRFGEMFTPGGDDGRNSVELYVHDRVTGTTATRPIDAADGVATTVLARGIAISADGRVIAFDSESGSLVAGDLNGSRDVFVDVCPVVALGEPGFAFCDPLTFPSLGAADGARFTLGAHAFRKVDTPADGLGPVFNGASCAECHNRPWVGGTSDRLVTRIGTDGPGGFDPLLSVGGPVVQTEGITTDTCSVGGESLPPEATLVSPRDPPALFGAGLIDAVADAAILKRADPTDANGDGISGRANVVGGRVGRFGRKAQVATLREFAGDAYLNEMGITSPDFPVDVAPQGAATTCDPVPDPEDADGSNVSGFVDFLTLLAPLPAGRYPDRATKTAAKHGRGVFRLIDCDTCHTDKLRTLATAPPPLAKRKLPMYSDLLLHDMGPGLADGIVQGDATGSEFRTAPLWGVLWSAPYLHDGRAATIADAIAAHGGEAAAARDAFLALDATQRAQLIAFLESL